MMFHARKYRPIKFEAIKLREPSPRTKDTEAHEKARSLAGKKPIFHILVLTDQRKSKICGGHRKSQKIYHLLWRTRIIVQEGQQSLKQR